MCSKVYKKGINLIARNIARIVVNYHLHDDLKTIFLVITTVLLTSHSMLTSNKAYSIHKLCCNASSWETRLFRATHGQRIQFQCWLTNTYRHTLSSLAAHTNTTVNAQVITYH